MPRPDIGRYTRQNPLMQKCFLRCNPFAGFPFYTFSYKFDKIFALAIIQCFLKGETFGDTVLTGRLDYSTLIVVIEESLPTGSLFQHPQRRHPQQLNIHHELIFLTFPREERIAGVHFRQHTAQRPHINSRSVPYSQDNFRRPIISALDIGIKLLLLIAATSQIDKLNPSFGLFLQHNILRFDITVDDTIGVQECQRMEDLDGELYQDWLWGRVEFVRFQVLVQVEGEKLVGNAGMTAKDEGAFHADYIVAVLGVFCYGFLQDLYLDFCLFVQFGDCSDYFQSYLLLFFVVLSTVYFTEGPTTQLLYNFISIGYGISNINQRKPLSISKLSSIIYSSFAFIINMVFLNFLQLKFRKLGLGRTLITFLRNFSLIFTQFIVIIEGIFPGRMDNILWFAFKFLMHGFLNTCRYGVDHKAGCFNFYFFGRMITQSSSPASTFAPTITTHMELEIRVKNKMIPIIIVIIIVRLSPKCHTFSHLIPYIHSPNIMDPNLIR